MLLFRYSSLKQAFRELPPLIARREGLPAGFRLREPLNLGVSYRSAVKAGIGAVAALAAPLLFHALTLIDTVQRATLLLLPLDLALLAGVFVLDRAVTAHLRERAGIAPDWLARIR
jgi:hypothetical protein